MTIRFAPARNRDALQHTIAWGAKGLPQGYAANDDDAAIEDQVLLAETLRHFAAYGLSAAERAQSMATAAGRAGNEAGYNHWLSICSMLDKRMAGRLAASEEFSRL